MSQSSVSADSTHHRLQFSLRTMFALVALIALGAALVVSYRQFQEIRLLREENARLRGEVGELKIEEGTEDKLQAIAMPTSEDMVWKWHVHVPDRKDIFLTLHVGKIGQSGLPGRPGGTWMSPGEYVIMAAYRQDHNGVWQWFVNTEPYPTRGSYVSSSNFVPDSQAKIIAGNHSTEFAGVGKTVTLAQPGKPLELLRLRVLPQPTAGPTQGGTEEGILVWIYEGTPGQ
jgi:hypothetical protein